jgi:hypothetical protein
MYRAKKIFYFKIQGVTNSFLFTHFGEGRGQKLVVAVRVCWDHASSPKVLQEETPSANLFIRDTEAIVHEASIL